MNTLTIVLITILVLLGICIGAIALLRKQPGLRRRREDPTYGGPARRMTDCSREIDEAHEAENTEITGEEHVKMTPSSRKKVTK